MTCEPPACGLSTCGPPTPGPAPRRHDKETGTVTLVRNPSWWGEPAKLDGLVLTAVPRARRTAELASGALDVAAIEPGTLAAARRAPGASVRKAPNAAYSQLA